jgi:hypothetical protein
MLKKFISALLISFVFTYAAHGFLNDPAPKPAPNDRVILMGECVAEGTEQYIRGFGVMYSPMLFRRSAGNSIRLQLLMKVRSGFTVAYYHEYILGLVKQLEGNPDIIQRIDMSDCAVGA